MSDKLCIQCGTRPVEMDGDEYCATWPRCKPAVEKYLPQLGKSSGEVWDESYQPPVDWAAGLVHREFEVRQEMRLETDTADHLTIEVVRDAVEQLGRGGWSERRIYASDPRFRVWLGEREIEGVTGFEMTLRNPDLVGPPERVTAPDYVFTSPFPSASLEERLRAMTFVIPSAQGTFDLRLIGDW